ncbi:hypothetical protein K0A97_03135 [Patescibacteria group bacterium]|nr:hypothetical protein [Patescibacteria group bacterium]
MGNLIIGNKKYDEYAFESEHDFEKAVVENSDLLFGKETIYIDVKRRIGEKDSYHKTIPDGFLIDFSNINEPQLYFVENELSTHELYKHITEQIGRFASSIISSEQQIREKLLKEIKINKKLLQKIEQIIKKSRFDNIDQLMIELTEKNNTKIVLVIDESTPDLELSLKIFKDAPDIVLLQRYLNGEQISYYYDTPFENIKEATKIGSSTIKTKEFDTVVCSAFEEGFNHAYVKNNAWWAVRLSQKAKEQLKYLAIYEKFPVGVIRNIAEIDRIAPYKDSNKYIIYLKNKQKISPIKYDKKGSAPQSPRFTNYDKITSSKKLSELWQ